MKTATTTAFEMNEPGHRLDASYHASEGVKALKLLKKWGEVSPNKKTSLSTVREERSPYGKNRLETLVNVCIPQGIFIPSRFKRIFVEDQEHGAPYITGSSILAPEPLQGAKYLSYRFTSNMKTLSLSEGMILVTCSGSIGNAAFVNKNFNGAVASPDLLRIIADPSKILPGYLFAFVSSTIGHALIEQKTYGAVVQHIEAHHVLNMLVPRIDSKIEKKIHDLVVKASDLRVEANKQLIHSRKSIEREVGFKSPKHTYEHQFSIGTSSIERDFSHRLDSFAYVGYVKDALQTLKSYRGLKLKASNAGFQIYNPPIFKRMFAPTGHPYMSGVEIYTVRPSTNRYLSKKQPGVEQYLVSNGMVLIQSAGQRYGLITTPVLVTQTLDGVAATSDIVRVLHEDEIENGYICALFSSEFGRRLALRYSYGTSIPRLDVPKFAHIEIPWPADDLRREIGRQTVEAYNKREEANQLEDKAQQLLLYSLGWEQN